MAIKRILVTGGAGFIGSHTVDALLADQKEVVVLDNLSSGKLSNLNLAHPHLKFIEGDVLMYDLLAKIVASVDAVLHLAAIASVPQSIDDPIHTLQVNTAGTLHVLEAVRQAKRDIRIVYASSAAVYGDIKTLPAQEAFATAATRLSPYALQKWQSEEYADLYQHLHGINSLGVRYFNVYGVRQDPNSPYSGVISRFMDAFEKQTQAVVFGDGLQTRDFIHVSDVAKANKLALYHTASGAMNIATGKPETLLSLIKCIEAAGKKSLHYRHEAARVGDILASYGDPSRAQQALQFKANKSLAEGIATMIEGVSLPE